jgi:outer membrane protein insertion porin family
LSGPRNAPGWAGYGWLALFCATTIFGGSLVFSDAPSRVNPLRAPGTELPDSLARGGAPGEAGGGDGSGMVDRGNEPGPASQQEQVIEVRIRGHDRIPVEKIIRHIRTRANRPYQPDMVEEDVRRLYHSRMFTDVNASTQQTPNGRIVIFEVHERPTLETIKYVGNHAIKRKQLAKQTGLKPGDPVDPYALEEGRRKLEEYYRSKGFSKVQITIIEGSRPSDRQAIYLIDEGPKQRHLWTQFVGNTIATDARLRTQIKSKPGIFWFFGGTVDPKQIDEDVNRLTAYYRGLGFFQAHVGRELSWNEDHNWLTLTFVINEGPRYKVRNVSVVGNTKFSTEELTADLKLKPGRYFNQDEMAADVAMMTDLYGGNGYVFAKVEADPRFLEEPGLLDLVYEIKEGHRYRVGPINVHIKGENPHTKWSTVLNRTSIVPGQIADTREFRASERRMKASQLFANDPTKNQVPKLTFKPPGGEMSDAEMADESPRRRNYRGQNPEPEVRRFQDAGYDANDGYAVPRPRAATSPWRAPIQTIEPGTERRGPTGMFATGSTTTQPGASFPGPGLPAPAAPDAGLGGLPPPPASPPSPPSGDLTAPFFGQSSAAAPQDSATGSQGWYPSGPSGYGNRQGLDALSPLTGRPPYEEPPIDLPLDWWLDETTTGRFMFSVGVNSDLGLLGSVVIDEQNFDWTRWPRSWEDIRTATAFRGAGQRFRLEAMPGTQLQRYTVNFTEPYLFDTRISLGLSGYYYDRRFVEWTERRIGGRVALGYQFRPDLSGTIAYRGESVAVWDPQIGLSGTVPPELQAVVGENALHSFRAQITLDTRDNAFLPTEGWLVEVGFEQTIGTFEYPRGDFDIRKYFLLRQRPDGSGRHVLSLGTRMGVSGENTPVYERYFAGGFSTLRGFAFRGASPRSDGVVVGGDFMLLHSLEYLFPITADDALRGVVFCDAGTVEPTIKNWTDRYRVAPGFGLRITVPAMGPAPIALDFAFPVSHEPSDRQQVFSFFIGFLR